MHIIPKIRGEHSNTRAISKIVHNAKQTFIINLNQKNACIDMFILT